MKKSYFLTFLFGLLLVNLQAQETEQFSLNDAIAYAQSHHSSIKNSQLDISHAKAQVQEYTSIGIPKLSASVDYNYFIHIPTQLVPNDAFAFEVPPQFQHLFPPPEPGYSETQFGTRNNLTFSFNLNTLVIDGSYFVGLQAAKGLLKLTKRQADLTKYQLRDVVTKAYLTVLVAEENRGVLKLNIENLQKMRAETQAFFKNGLVEKLDVDRLDLSLANLQTELEALNRQVDLAYNVLKFQMHFPFEKGLSLTDSLSALLEEPADSDLEGDISTDGRIEADLLSQNIYLNELNTKRYKMSYIPTLSAFATHQQVLQRDNLFDGNQPGFYPTTIVGLKLNVPLFDGLNTQAQIKKSKIDEMRFKIQLADFKRATTLEVMNAREVYKNAKLRLDNQDKNLELAEKILNTTKIKYREGVGSSLEMTQAEQELYRTQANRLNALYELVVAKSDLDKALGK